MPTKQADFNTGLLDMSIDDIEELAGFEAPVNGVYSLKMNTSLKKVNNKDAVEAAFELLECLEQNDPEEEPTKVGTKFSTLYFVENAVAMSNLKKLLAPIAEYSGERNTLKIVQEVCRDLVVVATVKRKEDKKEEGKFYADVSNIQVS